jgi:DNA-binding transcriptional LysR family regulator
MRRSAPVNLGGADADQWAAIQPREREQVMETKLRPARVRNLMPGRPVLMAAALAGCALAMIHGPQAEAASWGRMLNPQPLPPPGRYSPVGPGLIGSGVRASFSLHPARRVCVAWARECVKAEPGTPTHEGACAQYIQICEKYG